MENDDDDDLNDARTKCMKKMPCVENDKKNGEERLSE